MHEQEQAEFKVALLVNQPAEEPAFPPTVGLVFLKYSLIPQDDQLVPGISMIPRQARAFARDLLEAADVCEYGLSEDGDE